MEQASGISYKKVISGVVLLLLLGSLPFVYYLVTQTQVFKPKASTYDIDIVPKAGVSVIQENGVPVIQTTSPDEFKIKITSPLDSQPGADAGFSIVKPVYANHISIGTEFCEGNVPKFIGSDGTHNEQGNGLCGIPSVSNQYYICAVIGKKATCISPSGDMMGGGNIKSQQSPPQQPALKQPSQPATNLYSRGCYEEIQICDNNKGSQICKICDGGYDSTCQPCILSAPIAAPVAQQQPAAPATAPGSRASTGATTPSSSSCGKVCVYSEGDVCKSGNCLDGSQNCNTNQNCGYVPGCSSGVTSTCPTSGLTGSTTSVSSGQPGGSNTRSSGNVVVDEFADHSLDGKRSAYTCAEGPQDAEKPAGQYKWQADCSRKCMYNEEKGPGDPAGCPKNTVDTYVNPATSNWCYGFKDGNRCMQLKWTGTPALRSTTATITVTQPNTQNTRAQTLATPAAAQPAAPAPATPASPANPAPATPVPPAQPNNAGRKTTHYRVTTDLSRPGTWSVYTAGGVMLPYSFASFQPGKKVFLYVQFKDDLGNAFNAKPYPIEIRYVASSTPSTQNATCEKGKVCGGSDTPCGAGGAGKCDACNGGWCNGGKCETCTPDTATSDTTVRVACSDRSQITNTICGGGIETYDICTDDKSQTGSQLCKNGATKFKCVGSKNDYCQSPEYQCSSCPNFAPALTNPTCGTTCGGCPLKDTCGNRTYDTCDTTPCSATGASANTTFKCYAKDSPNNCAGEYLCGSVCARLITSPTTGTSTPGYEPE